MVKAIEHIRRDLTTVTERVSTVKQTLEEIYGDYLETLGISVERQLVLAGYQLCTQVYPEAFLQLSYAQREKMQQALRQLGQEIHAGLKGVLTDSTPVETEPEILVSEAIISADGDDMEQEFLDVFENIDRVMEEVEDLDEEDEDEDGEDDEDEDDEDEDRDSRNSGDRPSDREEDRERRAELSRLAERIAASISEMMQTKEAEPIEEGSPEALAQWYRETEKRIRGVLRRGSSQANRLFQISQILPEHVPLKVLDMAIQNDNHPGSSPQASNLVNLMIEADLGKKKKRRMRVTAIHLKLSEIEFGDPTVTGQRSRIREQLGKIKRLKKYYKKAKRDLAIAEAEAAWRASWHEGQLGG